MTRGLQKLRKRKTALTKWKRQGNRTEPEIRAFLTGFNMGWSNHAKRVSGKASGTSPAKRPKCVECKKEVPGHIVIHTSPLTLSEYFSTRKLAKKEGLCPECAVEILEQRIKKEGDNKK